MAETSRSKETIKRKRKVKTELLSSDEDEELERTNVRTKSQRSIKIEEGAGPSKAKRKNDNEEPKKKKVKVEKLKENVTVKKECSDIKPLWKQHELLSEIQNIDHNLSMKIINLFDEGNTIPFIARYRKGETANMSPEELRDVKVSYDKIVALAARSQAILKLIEKNGKLDSRLSMSILSAKSIEELEHIYAPYKPGGKRTLAERAKALGLEKPALSLMLNTKPVNINNYIDLNNAEADSYEKVEKGIIHIIAHNISTDPDVLTLLRKLRSEANCKIEVKKMIKKSTSKVKKDAIGKPVDELKYETYFDFKNFVKFIKPHQVLAINRGESQKVLSVKVVIPDFVLNRFTSFCTNKWIKQGIYDNNREKLLYQAVTDCYTRILQPLIVREIRADLKAKAEQSSCDVFSSNLKQLLLAAPIKGRSILAIDPGFSNGCKIAMVSFTGSLLESAILYPHKNKSDIAASTLCRLLKKYSCSLIALGNGTACRETEAWLSDLIRSNVFSPLDVRYTIVSENGASIYSCSDEAKKEFPDLDPNIISAVSLARRIQEPIAELVKVEPKHLGVGMYQHDLPKKQLEEALDEVVSECVSFVGVDLNTASQCLLRRVAGLADKRATLIIEHREKFGPFLNRNDLLKKIKGIGPVIFKQCAGFLRVGPLTTEEMADFYKNPKTNKLDCTIIHPESYDIAIKLINHLKLKLNDLGEESFIKSMKNNTKLLDHKTLSELFDTNEQTIALIVEALSKPLNHDLRNECPQEPLFKKGLTSLTDLRSGSVLTGSVANVTHFGCFVDIGVGCDGLIHISKMKGESLQIGNRVEVGVMNIDINRKRIQLELRKRV